MIYEGSLVGSRGSRGVFEATSPARRRWHSRECSGGTGTEHQRPV